MQPEAHDKNRPEPARTTPTAAPEAAAPPPAAQERATPSPEARATVESPSAPRAGDSVEGATPGLFEGWPTPGELADLLDEQLDQVNRATQVIDRELGDFVSEHGGLPAVLAATAAQTVVSLGREGVEDLKGRADVLRIGQGIAEGSAAGVVKDLGRAASVFPLASAFRAAGMAASAAFRKAINLRRQQLAFIRRVEEVYRKEVEHLMNTRPRMSPSDVGKEADRRTKEILAKEFEGVLEILFERETETTKGTKTDRMHNIDIVVPLLMLAIELKKSPAAVDRVQKIAHQTFCLIYDYTYVTIFGHP
jgi:hypothetical protein